MRNWSPIYKPLRMPKNSELRFTSEWLILLLAVIIMRGLRFWSDVFLMIDKRWKTEILTLPYRRSTGLNSSSSKMAGVVLWIVREDLKLINHKRGQHFLNYCTSLKQHALNCVAKDPEIHMVRAMRYSL